QNLTLIRAAEPLPTVLSAMHNAANSRHQDPLNGWGAMTSGRIQLVRVPGDHLTIMEEPHVAHLAETVADLLGTGHARTDRKG
ncbi:hypothetical protein, partial [Streptomyces sp. SID4982]|uniref:hypothetical protein n=1 Tax=Streptomyces sp. SID4982 TaxID=2690291 RepID=UPI001370244E